MDWSALYLFMTILGRMSGFVFFNPLFGRSNIPGIVKAGFSLLLAAVVFLTQPAAPAVPLTVLELSVHFLLEMALGFILGLAVNTFFYIPLLAGFSIDLQMGMTMGATYDPGSGANISVNASLLNLLMMMLFFAANGHHTLLRIILTSGDVVPFGAVTLGPDVYSAVLALLADCTLLAVKLCMPVLAAELLGQISMGILMKTIPQINVFAINIELKVIIGLIMYLFMLIPFSEFLLAAEHSMLTSLQELLSLMRAP
mgnify:CR=1 FL=1